MSRCRLSGSPTYLTSCATKGFRAAEKTGMAPAKRQSRDGDTILRGYTKMSVGFKKNDQEQEKKGKNSVETIIKKQTYFMG